MALVTPNVVKVDLVVLEDFDRDYTALPLFYNNRDTRLFNTAYGGGFIMVLLILKFEWH